MVVNLEFIKAIVIAEEVLLLDPLCQVVLPFVDQLRQQLPHTSMSKSQGGGQMDVQDNEMQLSFGGQWLPVPEAVEGLQCDLPFEFQVLEIALNVVDEEYHEEGEIKEVQSNRRLKYKAVMEENTLINSSSSLVSGSEGESNTLAPDKSTLESENWGGDFCNSDNIDSDSTEFEIGGLHYGPYSDDDGGLHYGPYSDDDGFRYETKETNFVWDGWEAALIVSKRMLADYYVKSSSEKEDSRKVLTLEPYETHFGKSNVRQTLELEGSGLATRKVVHDASWSGPISEEQYIKIGKAIAVLAHGAMCYVMFCSFKELIKDKDYNTVGESVFKSIVKFVLSVFDMEDFEKIFDQSVVEDEYSKLCEILDSCKCDPLVAIAEGKVKVDQFSTLREHDLCDTIREDFERIFDQSVVEAEYSKLCEILDSCKCDPLVAIAEGKVKVDQFSTLREHDLCDTIRWNDISPNEVAIALEMLRNYEPLKALGGVDIQLLRNCLPNTADDVFLAEDVTFACSVLADGLFVGLYELAAMKASALQYFQEAVIFPLSDGCFGPFTDEFIEVIKIADHERRMQGDRFISVKHLLFGLSLSSVRRCVEMMLHGRVLDYTGQLALKLSSFSIYKLSRDAATILGDKNVGLEHLVLAIFYGKQENDRTGTAAQDDCSSLFFDEKKWDDYLLKHCLSFGRPAALCGFSIKDELHKALKSGLKLNAIRG
ncbi:hypothetical protein TEA_016054 [Camellia sinensis var. sinensis]|uniref:Uncharacterized protein n=1 Tax=Camellia sinensis var. sinensis TaxID=542762 RepID=A0A4S4DCS9_CAMSN|nr:hypothetical protein TEA_016054 [Camellia sinensis var. sinensis]